MAEPIVYQISGEWNGTISFRPKRGLLYPNIDNTHLLIKKADGSEEHEHTVDKGRIHTAIIKTREKSEKVNLDIVGSSGELKLLRTDGDGHIEEAEMEIIYVPYGFREGESEILRYKRNGSSWDVEKTSRFTRFYGAGMNVRSCLEMIERDNGLGIDLPEYYDRAMRYARAS